MAMKLPFSARYSPFLHAPTGNRVVNSLTLTHNSMYRVISPSSLLLKRKTSFEVGSDLKHFKRVFRLPAVGEVGGEILFRLRVLNCVWILFPAVEDKGPHSCNWCVGSVSTRVLMDFYISIGLGSLLPHLMLLYG
jgi:hypothetical protein